MQIGPSFGLEAKRRETSAKGEDNPAGRASRKIKQEPSTQIVGDSVA
jgi:hypothetical protein